MRVAIIGRSLSLLRAAELIHARGHVIPIVWTCRSETIYAANERDFQEFASRIGALFLETVQIDKEFGRKTLSDQTCDLAVSVNWKTLLPPSVLGLFPRGVLNLHAGDLPRYRGNACPNWAILSGEKEMGMCVHEMTAGLDAGDILNRRLCPLSDETYIGDVYDWIDVVGPEMLADTVDEMAAGTVIRSPQSTDPADALRAYPRRPDDSRIVWNTPAREIVRLVRASSRPFDGAFCFLEGQQRIYVWRAEPVDHPGAFRAMPGQVCYSIEGDPVIAAADGMVRLTETRHTEGEGQQDARRLILGSLRNRLT